MNSTRSSHVRVIGVMGVMWMAVLAGCGSVQETSEQWETTTPVAVTARLEYRIDSLIAENRRIRQQVDVLSSENRNLAGRNAELAAQLHETRAAVKEAPPPPPLSPDLSSAYLAALQVYRQRDFSRAAQQFEALLNAGIREDLADNCHYWIGEATYGMGRYSDAIRHFEMVFTFTRSEKKDDAQLMIGNSYMAMGNATAAKEAFNKLISGYPASTYVEIARQKLGRLK